VLGTSGAVRAAEEVLAAGAGARTVLVRAGAAWSESAGGTSGALWGAALTAAGGQVSDQDGVDAAQVVAAVESAGDAIRRLGGAQPGDKTLVDALVPFVETLRSRHDAGADLTTAWAEAADAATAAAQATSGLQARLGRAKTHGDHSVGHSDPGAVSFALLVTAVSPASPETQP